MTNNQFERLTTPVQRSFAALANIELELLSHVLSTIFGPQIFQNRKTLRTVGQLKAICHMTFCMCVLGLSPRYTASSLLAKKAHSSIFFHLLA